MKPITLLCIALSLMLLGCTTSYKDITGKSELSSCIGSPVETTQVLYLTKPPEGEKNLSEYTLTEYDFSEVPKYSVIKEIPTGSPVSIEKIIRERSGDGHTWEHFLGTIKIDQKTYEFSAFAKLSGYYIEDITHSFFRISTNKKIDPTSRATQ